MSRTSPQFSPVLYWKGLPRLVVPRMVPPRGRIPETSLSVSSNDFSGQIRPSKPSGMPMTFHLYFRMAALVAARMTALRPGASPPPVAIPMQRMLDMVGQITRWAALSALRLPTVPACDHIVPCSRVAILRVDIERTRCATSPAPKSPLVDVRKLRPGSYGATVTFAVTTNTGDQL